jgi:hypothetical protein
MTPGKKYTFSTLLFYVLFFSTIPILEILSPGGPCVPGGGIMLLLFTPIISGLAFVVCLCVRLRGYRVFLGPLIINGVFFASFSLLFPWWRMF